MTTRGRPSGIKWANGQNGGVTWANGETEGNAGPGLAEVKPIEKSEAELKAQKEAANRETSPLTEKEKEAQQSTPKTAENAHRGAMNLHEQVRDEPVLPAGEARLAAAKAAAEAKKKPTNSAPVATATPAPNTGPAAPITPNVSTINPLSNPNLTLPTPPKTRKRKSNNGNGNNANGNGRNANGNGRNANGKLLTNASSTNTLKKLSGLTPNNNNAPNPLPPNNNGANNEGVKLTLADGLCTLLRVGGDSTSEYIELTESALGTKEFNLFGLGIGQVEFINLYKVSTAEDTKVMQEIFGVAAMGGKPPFFDYYTQQCNFPSKDTVLRILNTRIQSIQEQIANEGTSEKEKRYRHQLEWLQKCIADLPGFTNTCLPIEPCRKNVTITPGSSGSSGPSGSSGSSKGMNIGTNISGLDKHGCPCLTDINLLRDLVFLMTIIQGNASDDVKQKLSQIPIQKLLNAAKTNKPENISGPTKEILLLLLQHLSAVQKKNTAPDTKILVQIYNILNPTDTRNSITLDDLMAYLRVLSVKIQKCTESQAEIDRLKAELQKYVTGINNSNNTSKNERIAELEALRDDLQAQLAALQEQHAVAKQQLLNSHRPEGSINEFLNEDEMKDLNAKIELLEGQKAALQSTLDENTEEIRKLRLQVDGQQTEVSKVRADLVAAQASLAKAEAAKASAESQLITQGRDAAERDSELESLNASVEEARVTIADLTTKLAALTSSSTADLESLRAELSSKQSELDALKAALDEEKRQHEDCKKNVEVIQEEYDTTQAAYDALIKKGASKNNASNALQDELKNTRNRLQLYKDELEASKITLAALQASAATTNELSRQLTTTVKDLQEQLAQKTADLAAKTTEASGLDDQNKALRADLERVQSELDAATQSHNASLIGLQENLSTASRNSVACRTEIETLQARLTELEGKASRVNAAETTVEGLRAELEDEKAKLADCTKNAEAKQISHDADLAALRAQLEKAEAELAEARSKSGSNTVRAESAEAQVKALQGEIDGLRGTGGEAQTAFDAAKAALDTRISELEEQLKALDTSKTDAIAEEKKKCEEHVAGLQKQLDDMKAALEAAKLEAQSSVAAAGTAAAAAKAENTNKITSLSAELETIKGQLAAAKAAEAAAQAAKAQSESELAAARANAATQRARANAAEGALGSKVDASTLDDAKATIADLQAQLSGMGVLQKEKSALELTKQRLTNILTAIAISPEQKAAVQKILDGDESANLSSFYSTLDKETCDFFHYLYDTINIQLRYIHEIPVLKKNENIKADIFKIYTLGGDQNKGIVLEELTRLLQQFFVKFNPRTGIPDKGILIDGDYPQLQKLFSEVKFSIGIPVQTQLRDDLQSSKASESQTKLSAILRMGSFFPDTMKIQKDDTAFTDKQTKSIPLSILAIRLIQLLHETFDGKYNELKLRCSPKEVAPEETVAEENVAEEAPVPPAPVPPAPVPPAPVPPAPVEAPLENNIVVPSSEKLAQLLSEGRSRTKVKEVRESFHSRPGQRLRIRSSSPKTPNTILKVTK